jgi:peptidoglycan/xylan/chitin deacetylase (PgdA/CDA1 family)
MSRIGDIARGVMRRLPEGLSHRFARPAALTFHGVERTTDDARVQANHHEAEVFYEIAKSLKQNFDVLPLKMLGHVLNEPRRYSRAVFLMSDDGYANTLTLAGDILKQLGLPWALFVSTHHIETRERNPMFLARLFFAFAPDGRYPIPHFGTPILLGRSRDAVTEKALAHLKALPQGEACEAVRAMLKHVASDVDGLIARFRSEMFLTWDDVMALYRRGVEIGAHAHVHWAMHARQSRQFLREQAERPRKLITSHIGECRFFAYPFGNVADVSGEAWRAVRDAGYEYAFTTLSGSLDTHMNPFLLPRYTIGPRETDLARVVPLLRAGNSRVRRFQRTLAK